MERREVKFTIIITRRCNMSCTYCYSDNGAADIDEDTARRAVDLAYELVPPGEPLDLGFFGGEPLLRFDLMKKVVPYVRVKEKQACVQTALSVTTNGTVVNPDVLRFLREERFAYCVSLDGPRDVHDRYRVFADGSGSFARVTRNLRPADTAVFPRYASAWRARCRIGPPAR